MTELTFYGAPDVAYREAFGEGIVGVEDVVGEAGDPGAPAERGHDGGIFADASFTH
jgi:hypothetical protein